MNEKKSTDPIWGKMGEWAAYKTEWDANECEKSESKPACDPIYLEDRKKSKPIAGMIVFYIDVGQLPPEKAEAFVARIKERCNLERLYESHEIVWIPVRNHATRVQYIPFNQV